MPGRQRASRRYTRRPTRRWVRLRRTILVATSAALGFVLLGALDARLYSAGPGSAGADLDRSTEARAGQLLARAAASRPGSEPTAPAEVAAAVPPAPVETVPPTPAADVKPLAGTALPAGSGSGKRIVYGIAAQQVWLVDETNAVTRTYLVSGSRYDQLEPGTYEVFSKSESATSWHGTETMEYMVRFHRGAQANIGFHDIPVDTSTGAEVQTLSQLGTPLSDGCVRQDVADAQALWDFAPVGTPVVVLP
jgi:lipoprotein-anchoring transpeptidase ErfK/SrfK